MFEQVHASESFGYTVKTPLSSWVTSRRWITIFLLPPNMSSEWEKFTHMSRQLFKKQKKRYTTKYGCQDDELEQRLVVQKPKLCTESFFFFFGGGVCIAKSKLTDLI